MCAMPLVTSGAPDRPLDLPAGDRLIISVPASTANLGPAMDGLGMSVPLRLEVIVSGRHEHAGHAADGGATGTAYIRDLLSSLGVATAEWASVTSNAIPEQRGLGGSAAVRIASLLAAAAVLGLEPDTGRLLDDANALEGHPDNACAALCGGVVASALTAMGSVAWVELGPLDGLSLALAVPERRVATEDARAILPATIEHADGRFTASHVALLVAAIADRRFDLLAEATRDRLHQPHRLGLIPGGEPALAAALTAGAHAAFLSGSGSTLAALAPPDRADLVASEMVRLLYERARTKAEPIALALDGRGAEVTALDASGAERWSWRWSAAVRAAGGEV
jgi:homoserine kinase